MNSRGKSRIFSKLGIGIKQNVTEKGEREKCVCGGGGGGGGGTVGASKV